MNNEIHTTHAPDPVGPYAQARVVGDLVFCSGQIGLDPLTGTLVTGGAADELTQALKNVDAVLTAAGCTKADVARVDLFITDLACWSAVNTAYAAFFTERPFPARVTVEVKGLPLGASVEVACTAITTH